MSLSDEQAAFLLDACKLIAYATEQGFKVTGGELARTPEQQAIYFKTGRSKTMKTATVAASRPHPPDRCIWAPC